MLLGEVYKKEEVHESDYQVEHKCDLTIDDWVDRIRPHHQIPGKITPQQEAGQSKFITVPNQSLEASKDNQHPPPHKLFREAAQRPNNNACNNKST